MTTIPVALAPPIQPTPQPTKDKGSKEQVTTLSPLRKAPNKVTPPPPDLTTKNVETEDEYTLDPWLLEQARTEGNKPESQWITPVKKKRSHVDVATSEETDSRIKESVQETMRKRGEGLTDAMATKVTPVKIEFRIASAATKFNVRTALGRLMEQMKAVDRTAIFQSITDGTQWNTADDLPIGGTLKEHIVLRHENAPTQGNHISVYINVKSSKTIGEIKFHNDMYHYLSSQKIFLRPDRYKTEKTRSPDFFIKIHPRLVYKDTLKA